MIDEILQKAKKFCAYQERCTGDVIRKLQTFHITKEDEEKIIKQLKIEDYLNEERFVEQYVKHKVFDKKWGAVKIYHALFQKGISKSLIAEKVAQIDDQTFENQMKIAIEKWKRTHDFDNVDETKLIRHLLSKGFPYELIAKQLNK